MATVFAEPSHGKASAGKRKPVQYRAGRMTNACKIVPRQASLTAASSEFQLQAIFPKELLLLLEARGFELENAL